MNKKSDCAKPKIKCEKPAINSKGGPLQVKFNPKPKIASEIKKSIKQIEREKREIEWEKLRAENERKEIQNFLKKYPTDEERMEAIDENKIFLKLKEDYIRKSGGKKCFHETDYEKTRVEETKGVSIVTYFYCKLCGEDFKYEVCSPWHDGEDVYKDREYQNVITEIYSVPKKNKEIFDKLQFKLAAENFKKIQISSDLNYKH